MTRRIRYRYHRPGKGTMVFEQWLVSDRDDVKVLLTEHHEGSGIELGGRVVLEAGAPIVWFVFPGVAHDIGRFHLADGTFTGWYTNLCTPVRLDGDDWSSTDLFLDHWMPASGAPMWLDEDELAEAARAAVIDEEAQRLVAAERARLAGRLAARAWPPEVARAFDVGTARARLEAARRDGRPAGASSEVT